jgi:uncharacterized membrane protein
VTKTRLLLLIAGIVFFGHLLVIYLGLPETVATHFDGYGNANGWMSKEMFLVFESVLVVFVAVEFLLVPWFVRRLPNSLINLPNKEYWLADTRREETFAIFRTYFEVFGAAILALLVIVNHFVYRANIGRTSLPSYIWLVIVAFLLFVAVWLVRFIREFRLNK